MNIGSHVRFIGNYSPIWYVYKGNNSTGTIVGSMTHAPLIAVGQFHKNDQKFYEGCLTCCVVLWDEGLCAKEFANYSVVMTHDLELV